jgi:ribosome maturation factor RimP
MAVDLYELLAPVVGNTGLELVDVELRAGVLTVTVDRPGGVDLEGLTEVNRVVSALLDERDPIPSHYTLEVSSPGVERTLRRPDHFTRAVGETVSVKTRPQVPGDRRLTGTLVSADGDGLVLAVDDAKGVVTERRLAYSDIDRARTVFHWGPAPKPGGGSPGRTSGGDAGTKHTTQTKKRKQVTTS